MPIETQSRTQAVVDGLSSYIAEAGLKANDCLPAERKLAASLGVSRPILREALRHLAALGVIETKNGSGTYLREALSLHDQHIVMKLEAERTSLLQALELRRALEAEAAGLVAIHASDGEIAELGQLVDTLEREFYEAGDNIEADKAFHLALYRYCDNPLFSQLLAPIWELFEQFWQRPLGKKDFADRTLTLHRRIYERIRARDTEGARRAVRELLQIDEEDLRAH